MSTVADKLTALHGIKADLFAATGEKELDTTGKTLETLHELWSGISGGTLQAKSVVPSSSDVEVTPDAGYNALSAVNIAVALNLKPWNIRKGKTLFGITGTAEIAVSTDVPPDIPAQKDDADDAYKENVGDSPTDSEGNALDMMVLADDDGNITYGYFLQGAANGSANGTCLYNGVEFPDIETMWTDKTKYPYVVIYKNGTSFRLACLTQKLFIVSNGTEFNTDTPCTYVFFDYNATTGTWGAKKGPYTSTSSGGFYGSLSVNEFIWSNQNILNANGSVYLAASEPIPLDYNTIIRWDGNTEGRVTIDDIGSGTTMVKVSDDVITADQLRNCVVALKAIDTSVTKDAAVDMTNPPEGLNIGVAEYADIGFAGLSIPYVILVVGISDPDATFAELGWGEGCEAGTYILASFNDFNRVSLLAYNPASPSGFTITTYDPITTNFAAVGWRRLSYHTTGELAGQWTYDDFSKTPSTGGNYLKNIIQCSRDKLYCNGVEVWPNNRYGGEST